MSSWDEEDDFDFLNNDDDDGNDYKPSTASTRNFADAMMLDVDDELDDRMPEQTLSQQHPQSIVNAFDPNCDIDVNRPEYVVTDSVAYYNQAALMTLLYAHVTEGISIPAIFDKDRQSM